MTCEQYDATDHTPVANCAVPGMDVCRDCGWPPPKPGQMGNCWVRKNFTRYYTDEYGSINGISNMKKEIYARGPIGARKKFCFIYGRTAITFPHAYRISTKTFSLAGFICRLWHGRHAEV